MFIEFIHNFIKVINIYLLIQNAVKTFLFCIDYYVKFKSLIGLLFTDNMEL
jgi:hypothetical protein